jgi:hypothetical protein
MSLKNSAPQQLLLNNYNLMLQIITIHLVLCQYKRKKERKNIAANEQDTVEEQNHSELKNPTNFRNKNHAMAGCPTPTVSVPVHRNF